MRIAIASDHRGYAAKQRIKVFLEERGHQVQDFGTDSAASCDYPDVAYPAARSVRVGQNDRAIVLCGTGIGSSITANKVQGVRAALCHDELTAEMARRHNDSNVLCLAADLTGESLMQRIVDVWLNTPFDGGRHERRVNRIRQIEQAERDHDPG